MTANDTVGRQLRALGDETRMNIVACLGAEEWCVCELTESIGIPQPLLSFHLRVLKEAGLVSDRREGRWSYYVANAEALRDLARFMDTLVSAPRKPARRRRAC